MLWNDEGKKGGIWDVLAPDEFRLVDLASNSN